MTFWSKSHRRDQPRCIKKTHFCWIKQKFDLVLMQEGNFFLNVMLEQIIAMSYKSWITIILIGLSFTSQKKLEKIHIMWNKPYKISEDHLFLYYFAMSNNVLGSNIKLIEFCFIRTRLNVKEKTCLKNRRKGK